MGFSRPTSLQVKHCHTETCITSPTGTATYRADHRGVTYWLAGNTHCRVNAGVESSCVFVGGRRWGLVRLSSRRPSRAGGLHSVTCALLHASHWFIAVSRFASRWSAELRDWISAAVCVISVTVDHWWLTADRWPSSSEPCLMNQHLNYFHASVTFSLALIVILVLLC